LFEFYKDRVSSKDGHMHRCKACDKLYQKNNKSRPEIRKKSADKYRSVRNAKAREVNKQKRLEKYKNRLTGDELINAYKKYRAQRLIAKLSATPKWLSLDDRKKVTEIYAAAAMLQELTCSKYDVDHIVPLQSNVVCGLHVWWNMQPIPTSMNMQKRNIFEPSLYLDQGRVAFPDGNRAVLRAVHAAKPEMEDDDE